MTIVQVSITIWGSFQLTKGARFHQLNILHLKYSGEYERLISIPESQEFDVDEIARITGLIRQQPQDCLSEIGTTDIVVMKLIDTYQAVVICENDLGYADRLLASVEQYRLGTMGREDFVVELQKASSSFRESSTLFEPLITDTVEFIFATIIPVIISISVFNILLIGYFSRSISKSIGQVTDVFDAIANRNQDVSFPVDSNEEIERLIHSAEKFKQAKDELVDMSRLAGMAEVASSILHNVGNVLTGVNISIESLSDKIHRSRIVKFHQASLVVENNLSDMASFVSDDPKGKHLGKLIVTMGEHLKNERVEMLSLASKVSKGVDHIKEVVSTQQKISGNKGVEQNYSFERLVDDALSMVEDSTAQYSIQIKKDLKTFSSIRVDKHKLLQILVNIFTNAVDSIKLADVSSGVISIAAVEADEGFYGLKISDNGVGIPEDIIDDIFSFAFTTKKDGHGFGLHASALAAKSMGGQLDVESGGEGRGAAFILVLPNKESV